MTGIDVYHGDNGGNTIDWNAVKSGGASFAFAKATESTNFDDPMFSTNWSGMQAAGLVRGAYHFFDPAADSTAQANFFLAAVGPTSPGDLLVLDFETSGGESDATLAADAVTFLSQVQSMTGLTPLLYASSQFLSTFGPLGVYPLWVANYGVSCPDVPAAWTTYTFWQSSGSGSAGGISGQVDVDSFNGTLEQLQALGGDAGTPPVDSGTDTGTAPPVDSGTPPLVDSGSRQPQDSGSPSAQDSGGLVAVDSGGASAPDSGTSPVDAGRSALADAGNLAFDNSSPKGCSCRVGREPGSPGVGLSAFFLVMGLARARRRRRQPSV